MTSMLLEGRIVYPDEVIEGWIEVDGSEIIGSGRGPADREATRLDGFIAPAFVDLQVNGAAGYSFEQPEGVIEIEHTLLQRGVTRCLATLITSPVGDMVASSEYLDDRVRDHASPIEGIHLEGPFISPEASGMHKADLCIPATDPALDAYLTIDAAVVTLAPEIDGGLRLIDKLVDSGTVVSIGHTVADPEVAAEAERRGVSMATHLLNAMPGLSHRTYTLTDWILNESELNIGVITDAIHVNEFVLKVISRFASDRVIPVSDASPAAGVEEEEGEFTFGGVTIYKKGNLVTTGERRENGVLGLGGSGVLLDEAFTTWKRVTQRTICEVMTDVSFRPGAMLGIDTRLSPGNRADLIVLDEDYHVSKVMHRGKWVKR